MRPFEKNLKKLLSCDQMVSEKFLSGMDAGLNAAEVRTLAGFGFIEWKAKDGGPVETHSFSLTDKAFDYFENKRLERKAFIQDFFSRFFSGVLTGVVATLITTYLAGWLHF